MTITMLAFPRQRDLTAELDRERFGKAVLLSGMAYLGRPGVPLTFDYPLAVGWDARGRQAYVSADGAHTLLCTTTDAATWHEYAEDAGIAPHTVPHPSDQRERLADHVAHVWLNPDRSYDPVVAFGWASFPAVTRT